MSEKPKTNKESHQRPLRGTRSLGRLLEAAALQSNLPSRYEVLHGTYEMHRVRSYFDKAGVIADPGSFKGGQVLTFDDQQKIAHHAVKTWPAKAPVKNVPPEILADLEVARKRWLENIDALLKSDQFTD